jgi:hypothetical protein
MEEKVFQLAVDMRMASVSSDTKLDKAVVSMSKTLQEIECGSAKLSDLEVAERMMLWWGERATKLSKEKHDV